MEEFIVIVIVAIMLFGLLASLYDSNQEKKETNKKEKAKFMEKNIEIRNYVHDFKFQCWEKHKKIKQENENYKISLVFDCTKMDDDEYISCCYQEELNKINKKKEEWKQLENFKKHENEKAKRWGKSLPYTESKPYELWLQKQLDIDLSIKNMPFFEVWNGKRPCTQYSYYAHEVRSCMNSLAYWQCHLYSNFGLDDNAQGIELKKMKILKSKLPVVEDAFGNPLEDFDWFPYQNMDRAYFED